MSTSMPLEGDTTDRIRNRLLGLESSRVLGFRRPPVQFQDVGSGGRTSSPEKTGRCCGASPGAVSCRCQPPRVALWLQQLHPCHVYCTHSVIPLPSGALTWLPSSFLLTSSELRQTSAIFFFFFFFLFFNVVFCKY